MTTQFNPIVRKTGDNASQVDLIKQARNLVQQTLKTAKNTLTRYDEFFGNQRQQYQRVRNARQVCQENPKGAFIKKRLDKKLQELTRCLSLTRRRWLQKKVDNPQILFANEHTQKLDRQIKRLNWIETAEQNIQKRNQEISQTTGPIFRYIQMTYKKLKKAPLHLKELYELTQMYKDTDPKVVDLMVSDTIADAYLRRYNLEIEKIVYIQTCIARTENNTAELERIKKLRNTELNEQKEDALSKLRYLSGLLRRSRFQSQRGRTSIPMSQQRRTKLTKFPSQGQATFVISELVRKILPATAKEYEDAIEGLKNIDEETNDTKLSISPDKLEQCKQYLRQEKRRFDGKRLLHLNKKVDILTNQLKMFNVSYQENMKDAIPQVKTFNPNDKKNISFSPLSEKIKLSTADFIIRGFIVLSTIAFIYYAIKYTVPKIRTWLKS